ncbi:MAG TPA: GntR family transcriptional regulator [Pseudolabrys sp.]|nr:GntR family transcriptional regulator [Pseudolabrys sp.]
MDSLVAPKTLMDQAYATILDAICNGTLKPGERLTQDNIAQRLNVSRQPIHNALLLLKAQGFVREAGRRGVSVVPLDPGLFEAIYQFRSAVEPLAVILAIPHLNADAIKEGRSLIARGQSAANRKDGKALLAADMAFHSLIYECSNNSLILETMRLNWHHLRRAMREVLDLPGLAQRVWKEHQAIFESMVAGQPDEAARLMRDHVVLAHRDVAIALKARR